MTLPPAALSYTSSVLPRLTNLRSSHYSPLSTPTNTLSRYRRLSEERTLYILGRIERGDSWCGKPASMVPAWSW
ncbi:hypothetical protein M413DRAFT_448109 [Hebeloma cylindrosporum]|uniref:Uncharacterized protein n=1 Tax=Hebeloma cylindrosporum TaxID=76867 RepID=A0A0C2YAS9_HEBCY|nr:hypothetical protein M413DRAFT_448109 [Hebeloma cylindrosporum h7]